MKDAAAALLALPPAPCLVVLSDATSVSVAISQKTLPYPAPVVHDLQALERWGGCGDGAEGRDDCLAALQMMILGDCSGLIGSFDR